MIQLKINNMDHKAILTVPADYERVVLALWTIGLDRDPEKYTLRQLDAEFTYTTEEESQMVRLIDPRSSLMNALCFLSEMVYPPYPVAERIHKKMAAGGYASKDDFFIEMEKLVYDQNLDMHIFYFPISGEVVNKRGLVRKASDPLLLKYEHLLHSAIHRVQRQISSSDTKLFEDVDADKEKLNRVVPSKYYVPAAFLVCYDKSKCWTRKFDRKTSGEIDASIVTTHMMMEATSLGLGSIWVMYWNPDTMKTEFEIPEQYEPVALLIVGYADKSIEPHKEHFIRQSIDDVML